MENFGIYGLIAAVVCFCLIVVINGKRILDLEKIIGKWKRPKIGEKDLEIERQKTKILEMFNEKDEITNNDVEELLDVSDSTATRRLQELEEEGKIKSFGNYPRITYLLK